MKKINKDPLKIVHLINHCRLGHGNVHAAVDLACVQALSGDHVFYAGEGGEFQDLLSQEGVKFLFLKQRSRNIFVILKTLLSLFIMVRREKINILHAHMMSGAVLGYFVSRVTGCKLITTVHNSFDSHSWIMKFADKIAAVSQLDANYLINKGFNSKKVQVIMNGPLGSARFNFFADTGQSPKRHPNIVTVCGLHERKGVSFLLEAFKIVRNHRECFLDIVGDGPDRHKLENLAESLGIREYVTFHGSLANPGEILRGSDIFVLASTSEPLGLVNIEARAAGCAVIATDVGGIPEALDNGAAGLLVAPKSAFAIADSILRLLDSKAELNKWRARASQNLARFHVSKFYEGYDTLYRSP